jgi:hypothetical protein
MPVVNGGEGSPVDAALLVDVGDAAPVLGETVAVVAERPVSLARKRTYTAPRSDPPSPVQSSNGEVRCPITVDVAHSSDRPAKVIVFVEHALEIPLGVRNLLLGLHCAVFVQQQHVHRAVS